MNKATITLLERVARLSMRLARRCVSSYGSIKSRKDFTQPQLMTCLVLREAMSLEKVPHFTT